MKNDKQKFPILAVVLTFVALALGVACASTGIYLATYRTSGTTTLALFEIGLAVLFIAGLTAAKNILLRIVSTIVTVSIVVVAFVTTLVNLTGGTGGTVTTRTILFAISLLMLICAILNLIYFFMNKTNRIKAMYKFTGYTFSILTFVYGIAYIVVDFMYVDAYNGSHQVPAELSFNVYFLTFALAFISLIPIVTNKLLDEEEEKQQIEKIQ